MVTELCPTESEPNWVLNFKRGLLTLLHNSMRRFDLDHESVETDVHGTCATKYTLVGARNTSLIIEKTKDIGSCQDRYKHQSILQTTPYIFRSVSKNKGLCCWNCIQYRKPEEHYPEVYILMFFLSELPSNSDHEIECYLWIVNWPSCLQRCRVSWTPYISAVFKQSRGRYNTSASKTHASEWDCRTRLRGETSCYGGTSGKFSIRSSDHSKAHVRRTQGVARSDKEALQT